MNGLYAVYKKEKCMRDIEDQFLMQVVSDFLGFLMKSATESMEFKDISPDNFHFVFIAPSEWPEGIRLELIRPIFVKANLISEDDHQDRLLFLTNAESIFYNLVNSEDNFTLERGQNTILARHVSTEPGKVLVKLDLVQTPDELFDFDGSRRFPKVMRSDSFSITSEYIKNSIGDFLKNILDPMPNDLAMEAMVEGLFNSELPSMDAYDSNGELQIPWFTSEINWEINKSQEEFIKSLHPFEICDTFESAFIDNLRNLVSNNFMKEYMLLLVENQSYSTCVSESALVNWIKCILDYNKRLLGLITNIYDANIDKFLISPDILLGACNYMLGAVQNSNIYSMPRILPMEADATSASTKYTCPNTKRTVPRPQ